MILKPSTLSKWEDALVHHGNTYILLFNESFGSHTFSGLFSVAT